MIKTININGEEICEEQNQLKTIEWLPIWGVVIMVALVYSPIVINAFNGDDFVHLAWLSKAVHQPELVWRNFHSAWLGITTAKFYRPLISLFMLSDYVLWQANGIGFHLTNLLCHIANTCLVWLVLRQLTMQNHGQRLNYIWCVASSALFGLYPLHPEAVSWITGRVDTFVTLFFLASLVCYMHWRQYTPVRGIESKKNKWLCLGLISMALALLCKEMAIILPALFCAYEVIVVGKATNHKQNVLARIQEIAVQTSPFWLLLFFYFVVRYYALGTFIGGYDNSFLAFDNWQTLLSNWKRSIYLLCFPFNETLLDKHSSIKYLWGFLLLTNAMLIVKQVFWQRKNVAIFLFLISWLVLSLVPVYKLFNISCDLQGSRLAYLPTVPLCALFCFGYIGFIEHRKKMNYGSLAALIIMISAAGAGLLVNNFAWLKAENTTQAVVSELNSLSKTTRKDSVVYIVGLPDQINGAYACRNALDGMSKYPQISKDIRYCFNLNEINQVFPFGYARQAMINRGTDGQDCQFYRWDQALLKLKKFSIPQSDIASGCESDLANKNLQIDLDKDVSTNDLGTVVNLRGKPCFKIDCLKFEIVCDQSAMMSTKTKNIPLNCTLFYTNDLYSQFDSVHRSDFLSDSPLIGEHELIFPLHGQSDWAMGGNALNLKLVLPRKIHFKIKNVTVEPLSKMMPVVTFKPNANQNILGFIELSHKFPSCELNYDGSKVVGAENLRLEMTYPDQTFAVANDVKGYSLQKNLNGLSGLLSLTKRDFPGSGIYEIRVRAFDRENQPIGIAGDHIVVTVKSNH